MKIMRRGLTRTVYLTRKHAIKVPSMRRYGAGLGGLWWSLARGVLANQSEREWWNVADEDTRTKLCPVKRSWLGGIINVYPRCVPYEVDEDTALAMFRREYRPLDIDPMPSDTKAENYGWLDGRLVCLDYDMSFNGCQHDRSGAVNRREQDEEDDEE